MSATRASPAKIMLLEGVYFARCLKNYIALSFKLRIMFIIADSFSTVCSDGVMLFSVQYLRTELAKLDLHSKRKCSIVSCVLHIMQFGFIVGSIWFR